MAILKRPFGFRKIPEEVPVYTISQITVTDTEGLVDIRPPEGTIWELIYASIRINNTPTLAAADILTMEIRIFNTIPYSIKLDAMRDGQEVNFEDFGVEFSSFGVAPVILTNETYMQLRTYGLAAGSSAVMDFFAVARVI